MNAACALHGLDIVAAPTTNNIEKSSEDEEEDSEEVESAEENMEKEDNVEEMGDEEVESVEENVAVMEEEGGEDDKKTDGKEATDDKATNEAHKTDVAGGGEHPAVDTQDADCEPFQQTTDRRMTTPPWGRRRTRICPPLLERKDQLTNGTIRRQPGRALVSAAPPLDTEEMRHEGELGKDSSD